MSRHCSNQWIWRRVFLLPFFFPSHHQSGCRARSLSHRERAEAGRSRSFRLRPWRPRPSSVGRRNHGAPGRFWHRCQAKPLGASSWWRRRPRDRGGQHDRPRGREARPRLIEPVRQRRIRSAERRRSRVCGAGPRQSRKGPSAVERATTRNKPVLFHRRDEQATSQLHQTRSASKRLRALRDEISPICLEITAKGSFLAEMNRP